MSGVDLVCHISVIRCGLTCFNCLVDGVVCGCLPMVEETRVGVGLEKSKSVVSLCGLV